jgi:Spy/CpxP family protein refolding chaperone
MHDRTLKPKAMAGLLLVLAMGVGLVAGIAVDRLVLLPRTGYAAAATDRIAEVPAGDRRSSPRGERRGAPGYHGAGERYLMHLERELGLTPEQKARIEALLHQQQERVMELTRETRRELARETRSDIDSVLTADQRERLRELRRQRDRDRAIEGEGIRP